MDGIQEFIDKFKNELGIDEKVVLPTTQFQDQDYWDSLNGITVLLMIEEEYNVEISNDEVLGFKTIQDLYNEVKSRQ